MNSAELVNSIIEALAVVRAVSAQDLVGEIDNLGTDAVMLSSHEVVTVLVMLRPATGIDPTDPGILKGCNLQSLGHLVGFMASATEAAR